MGKDQILSLHNLKNVNTVLSMLYDKDGNYRAGFTPDVFYNTILLDTLKYGEENFVHLKYAENLQIKKGFKTAKFRRWAGMTPTLRPLMEGVPPAPDKHAYEVLEIGNVWSFGRWSEYTDQVDNSIVSEVIAERTLQYGELANQIKELYARKVWLSSPNEYYANFKEGFSELGFGDGVTLDDLRFLISRMKRMLVKPISGKFNYICSSEFINGLIDDPRVVEYMKLEQTAGKLYTSGEPFDLFELSFIPTMLDEFAYPDTEFPGVYELPDGKEAIRLYALNDTKDYIYYLDVHQSYQTGEGLTAKYNTGIKYLPDGTAIDEGWEKWEVPSTVTLENAKGVGLPTASQVVIKKASRTYDQEKRMHVYGNMEAAGADLTVVNALISQGKFTQLPVHRGILFGAEALVKLNVEGVSDAPKMIIKPLGSSGVADPLDQRQSVGFRVDGFGLAIKRPEALCVTYGIPKNAEFAALTAQTVYGNYETLTNYDLGNDESITVNTITDGVQDMHVNGVNNIIDTITVKRSYKVWELNDEGERVQVTKYVKYSEGELVSEGDKFYVFLKGYTFASDSTTMESLVASKVVKEVKIAHKTVTLDADNSSESNVK